MKNYFRGRKTQRKNKFDEDKRIGKVAIVNIVIACLFWILSLVIAGVNEYHNSGWVLAGMMLPALLFASIRKAAKFLIVVFVVLNFGSMFYPLLEIIRIFSDVKQLVFAQWIFAGTVIVGSFFLVKTAVTLFKMSVKV